ncbi:MAG: flagellar export chaperone FliS [Gemmatimonadaceae bacterium]|nr:flagellar export chaperone FliS [Gemmatimonadaceae bacterium]
MSYPSANGAQYREMQVRTASPARLVVLLYEHLEVTMRRARLAIDNGQVELRVTNLGKARAILAELLGTLDFEKGGTIATDLSALYSFLLAELVDVGMTRDVARLDRLTGIVRTLGEGFAGAAEQLERDGIDWRAAAAAPAVATAGA